MKYANFEFKSEQYEQVEITCKIDKIIEKETDGIAVNEEENVNMTGTMDQLKIEMNGF